MMPYAPSYLVVAAPARESTGIRHAQCGVVIAAERDRASRLPGHGRHQVQEGLVAVWEVAGQLNGHRHPLRVARYVATRRMRRYLVMDALREGREAERQQRVLDALLPRRRAKAVA